MTLASSIMPSPTFRPRGSPFSLGVTDIAYAIISVMGFDFDFGVIDYGFINILVRGFSTLSCIQILDLVLPIKTKYLRGYCWGVSYVRDPIIVFKAQGLMR